MTWPSEKKVISSAMEEIMERLSLLERHGKKREIPKRLLDALDGYARDGIPPGGFLRACLENDCLNAVCLADGDSIRVMPEIMRHIANEEEGRICSD